MNQGRIIVITGAPGTGKTTTASAVAKESDLEKSVHMHTDDFYHYLSKGAIPPHLPESNEQNLIVIEAFLEAAKRYPFSAPATGLPMRIIYLTARLRNMPFIHAHLRKSEKPSRTSFRRFSAGGVKSHTRIS